VDRRNQILFTSQSADETTSELLFVMEGPQNQRKQKKKPYSNLPHKLPNKRGSTLPCKAQNTKHQYQDWMLKE
jgi:hypothetical protein